MKIIDLLNKIANGEEVHAKHKLIEVKYYRENDFGISYRTGNQITFKDLIRILNDEVEIIEEEKKIEKIDYRWYNDDIENEELLDIHSQELTKVKDKLNQIIDKINEMENK